MRRIKFSTRSQLLFVFLFLHRSSYSDATQRNGGSVSSNNPSFCRHSVCQKRRREKADNSQRRHDKGIGRGGSDSSELLQDFEEQIKQMRLEMERELENLKETAANAAQQMRSTEAEHMDDEKFERRTRKERSESNEDYPNLGNPKSKSTDRAASISVETVDDSELIDLDINNEVKQSSSDDPHDTNVSGESDNQNDNSEAFNEQPDFGNDKNDPDSDVLEALLDKVDEEKVADILDSVVDDAEATDKGNSTSVDSKQNEKVECDSVSEQNGSKGEQVHQDENELESVMELNKVKQELALALQPKNQVITGLKEKATYAGICIVFALFIQSFLALLIMPHLVSPAIGKSIGFGIGIIISPWVVTLVRNRRKHKEIINEDKLAIDFKTE